LGELVFRIAKEGAKARQDIGRQVVRAFQVAGREGGKWRALRPLLPERQVKAQYQVSGVGERSLEID
jgi:hypothetical protein